MDFRLDQPFELTGRFRLPVEGAPEVRGKLTYDPSRHIRLELEQSPYGKPKPPAGPEPIIWGVLENNVPATLCDCYVNCWLPFAPSSVIVNSAIIGHQLSNLAMLPLTKFSLELSSLVGWTEARPIASQDVHNDGYLEGVDISFRRPAPITVQMSGQGIELVIRHLMSHNSSDTEAGVKCRADLSLEAKTPLPFAHLREAAFQIRNLFSLFYNHPASVNAVSLTHEERVLSFIGLDFFRRNSPDRHAMEMLLSYKPVQEDLGAILNAWFSRTEQAKMACNIFFASMVQMPMGADYELISMTQAAESYHRSLSPGLYMDKETYSEATAEIIERMPATICGDHRASLRARLMYGNEYSLRKRLHELLERLPDALQRAIAAKTDFVEAVVRIRNYYTHWDQSTRPCQDIAEAAHKAAKRVRVLVVANILNDLGITGERLTKTMLRNWHYRHDLGLSEIAGS